MARTRTKVLVFLVCAVVLGGLVALASPAIGVFVPLAAGASTAVSSALAPTPSPTAADAAVGQIEQRDRCNPNQGSRIMMSDPVAGGSLNARSFADMRDLGPRQFATGKATFNADGLPATYTVAPGDAPLAIDARFCLTGMEMNLLNAARFCLGHTIQPGDVYNLDPYTVASVGGSVNGICTNEPGFTLP